MNSIYLIGVLVIVILLYYFDKRNNTNQASIKNNNAVQEPVERNITNRRPTKMNKELSNPEMAAKNKWLYPTDEFGKMEEGKVYESKTYESRLSDDENITKFSIKLKHRPTNDRL